MPPQRRHGDAVRGGKRAVATWIALSESLPRRQ